MPWWAVWLLGVKPADAVLRLTWPRGVETFVLFLNLRKMPSRIPTFLSSGGCPFKQNKKKHNATTKNTTH